MRARAHIWPIVVLLMSLVAVSADAAGGGGGAGGAGAQNHPASGLPIGEAGPAGSPNSPRGHALDVSKGGTPSTSEQDGATPDRKRDQ